MGDENVEIKGMECGNWKGEKKINSQRIQTKGIKG
jgi:hypothetical protein